MRAVGRWLALTLLILSAVACEPRGPDMLVRNTTNVPVKLFTSTTGKPPMYPLEELMPGKEETYSSSGGFAGYTRRIEAWDQQGILLFCQIYTLKDVRDGKLEVTITAGEKKC